MARRLLIRALLLSLLAVGVSTTAELDEHGLQGDLIGAARNRFGYAIAVSGDYAVIGHPRDYAQGTLSGSAHIYERRETGWKRVAKLLPDDGSVLDFFGTAVAIDGNTAVIGAYRADRTRGAAYVFERRNGVWLQVQKLTASDATPRSYLGRAVAISGKAIVVGAPDDGEAGRRAGAVYVFERQEGVWQPHEVQKLFASDATREVRFGAAVALDGPYALIGAPRHDDGSHIRADYGAAYIFERQEGGWVEIARLQAEDGQRRDDFGHAVALSGHEALIGSPGHHRHGAAYLFVRQADDWSNTAVQKLTGRDRRHGDRFGVAVALSGHSLLVGASRDQSDAGERHDVALRRLRGRRRGAAYLFVRQAENWEEMEKLTPPLTRYRLYFGYTVALSETHALVGAPAIGGGIKGRAYAYSGLRPNHHTPEILSIPFTTATVGEPYTYVVEATDADGDALHYTLLHAPVDMVIDANGGRITWTPTTPGEVAVTVAVDDGRGRQATQAFSIIVSPSNQPPTIVSTPITSTTIFHVMPLVTITDAHLARQTITLNGQPFTSGAAITSDGDYVLTAEATDVAGNTTVMTVHFTLTSTPPSQ